jgi:hypothetical protein
LFLQISATFVDYAFRLAQVCVILQRRKRASLSDAVHVEWLPCSVKHIDHVRPGNSITNAQPSEPMNLRKCS